MIRKLKKIFNKLSYDYKLILIVTTILGLFIIGPQTQPVLRYISFGVAGGLTSLYVAKGLRLDEYEASEDYLEDVLEQTYLDGKK